MELPEEGCPKPGIKKKVGHIMSYDGHVMVMWLSFYYCSGMQAQRNSSEAKVTAHLPSHPSPLHVVPPPSTCNPLICHLSSLYPHSFPSPPVTLSKFHKPSVGLTPIAIGGEHCELIIDGILLHLLVNYSLFLSFLNPFLLSFLVPSLLSLLIYSLLPPSLHQGTKNYRASLSLP